MTELEFFYRDDDPSERRRVGKIIAMGGCKPVLWETLEEMKDNWHNGFAGGATDDQIVSKGGMITSGAEDIAELSKSYQIQFPLALLTNVSNIELLKVNYGHGPTGIFQEYFDKEDALLPKPGQTVSAFENYVRECSLSKSTEEEKLAAYRITLKDLDLSGKSTELLINQNEVTFPAGEHLGLMTTWSTLDDMCDPAIFQGLSAESRKKILDKFSTLIKNHYLNSS